MKSRSSITTRRGDGGRTSLYSGERVAKDSPRCRACGSVDELVCALGVARAQARRSWVRRALESVQKDLFAVAAEFATSPGHVPSLRRRIGDGDVADLTRAAAVIERRRRLPRGFIVPGATPGGAWIDHARATARRCEREAVALFRHKQLRNRAILAWLNRLSDYLWLLARAEEGRSTPLREST